MTSVQHFLLGNFLLNSAVADTVWSDDVKTRTILNLINIIQLYFISLIFYNSYFLVYCKRWIFMIFLFNFITHLYKYVVQKAVLKKYSPNFEVKGDKIGLRSQVRSGSPSVT